MSNILDEKKTHIASQFRVASISYGIFIVLIGTVFNTIEPFKACTVCENTIKIIIESFYIYLYAISIAWIFTMVIFILISKRQQRVAIKKSGVDRRLNYHDRNDQSSIMKSIQKQLSKTFISKPNHTEGSSHEREICLNDSPSLEIDTIKHRPREESHHFDFTYDYENGSGELYMRCGTAIFSICAMIDQCLSLIQLFEFYNNKYDVMQDCKITFTVTIIERMLGFLFIFLQSFFIFKYANIIINYGKNMSRIGLMHIVVTNFCVSVRTVIHETVSEIRHHNHAQSHANIDHNFSSLHPSNATNRNNIMKLGCIYSTERFDTLVFDSDVVFYVQDAREKLDSYLYPSIIEYSLMSFTVFFILWNSIELLHFTKRDSAGRRRSSLTSHRTMFLSMSHLHHAGDFDPNKFSIDCSKSTTGLFVGIFSLLLTIISLITYFIYKAKQPDSSIILSEITELFLLIFSLMIIILIFWKLKNHGFKHRVMENLCYNSLLTIVGLAGVYLYGLFSIIALLSKEEKTNVHKISILIQIFSIIEPTLQSAFIINGFHMYTENKLNLQNKPARSLITLLILLDVCLWLTETISVKKYDMSGAQLEYYDIIFWSIVSSISSPLAIFFRFHASVCLSDIWKTLYE